MVGQAASLRPVLVPTSLTIRLAVGATTLGLATHRDGTWGLGASRVVRQHRTGFHGPRPSKLGCGILGVQAWI